MFITKSKKSPCYQITYKVNGKRTTISTKTTNRKEAEKFLATFDPNSYRNVEAQKKISQDNSVITLSSFCVEYLAYTKSTKSNSYITSIELSFRKFTEFVGNILMGNISLKQIDQFISFSFTRTQRGAHQYYRTLKAAFNKAVEWNYIKSNPFSSVKFPKISKSYPAFLTEDELYMILSNTPHQHLKDIFITAFYTGMRLNELINMKWEWIDFSNRLITIKCSNEFITKSKRERIIPMSNTVFLTLINRHKVSTYSKSEFVFYRIKNVKLHDETISKQFKQVVRLLSLDEKIHFHSLRHSFASLLVQKGVSLSVVKELLGHEDLATTQIYSHLQQQNLREAINIF